MEKVLVKCNEEIHEPQYGVKRFRFSSSDGGSKNYRPLSLEIILSDKEEGYKEGQEFYLSLDPVNGMARGYKVEDIQITPTDKIIEGPIDESIKGHRWASSFDEDLDNRPG